MRALFILALFSVVQARYLVQLSEAPSATQFLERHPTLQAAVTKTFSFGNFHAFVGDFGQDMLKLLSQSAEVEAISADIEVKADETQQSAPRHLARLASRSKLSSSANDSDGDGDSSIEFSYYYSGEGQSDVDVYIIDTGVHAAHPEFGGRVTQEPDLSGEGMGDFNGHGTHVAGLIGSVTYGVAKNVSMIDVKALSGKGTGDLSTVITGIDYAVHHHQKSGRKAVANLSLGAGYNAMLNNAVNAAVDAGLPMVVAAGNSNSAACGASPASASRAITVGAIDDRYDTVASFSNWGSCVTLFAPGVYVTSVTNNAAQTMALSGTSMAAPQVAGIIATLLARGSTEDEVRDQVVEMATTGAIERRSIFFRPRTPNRVAFSGFDYDPRRHEDVSEPKDGRGEGESSARDDDQEEPDDGGQGPDHALNAQTDTANAVPGKKNADDDYYDGDEDEEDNDDDINPWGRLWPPIPALRTHRRIKGMMGRIRGN